MKSNILKPTDFFEGLKIIKTNPKTRSQLSNPNSHLTHDELLKKAGVKTFSKYEIEDLGNGRIKVIPQD